jgi:hypothetical protein
MNGHRYTPEEIRFLKKKVAGRSYAELTALFNRRFGLEITVSQMGSNVKRYGLSNGRDCRFKPGQVSHNKGKHGCYPGCEKTQFKPGHRPWNWRPVGSERVNADGYTEVKVRNPHKWKFKHVLVWEAAHGKVPKGRVIIFADGNRQNLKLKNLLLVSRSELAVMNHSGLFSGNAELTKAGKSVADIKMLVAGRKKKVPPRKTRRKFA